MAWLWFTSRLPVGGSPVKPPIRLDPEPLPASLPDPYPHATPRHVHQLGGVWKRVETPQECADALNDGWFLHPPNESTHGR